MMSKAELSRNAQVSPITIARIENGMPCRLETMRKIIISLGKELSDKNMIFPWMSMNTYNTCKKWGLFNGS